MMGKLHPTRRFASSKNLPGTDQNLHWDIDIRVIGLLYLSVLHCFGD